jgi:2,3-bisphosphoglycerate-independent phosphoglycerate mutase
MNYKVLFVILDGVGDHTIKDLGSKTPLEAAKKPNIDYLAKYGENGMIYPIDIGVTPGSDTAHLSLFGYDPYRDYPGRGVFEALGTGIELKKGDVAFRVNVATVDDQLRVIDRRAGRNDYGIEQLFQELNGIEIEGIKIILKHTVEHRGVLVLRGSGLSKEVEGNDPHKVGTRVKEFKALDKNAEKIAEILEMLTKKFYELARKHPINEERKRKGLLPANYLLIRGAGMLKEVEPFEKKWGLKASFIAGAAMYLGVARYVGIEAFAPPGATGTVKTSLISKAESAIAERDKKDIVFVHIKATDSLSHDRKPIDKKKFIELIDRQFFSRVKDEFDIIIVTGDHTTSSVFGEHTADPVPLLIYSTIAQRKDSVKNFAERKSYKGILGFVKGRDLMRIIINKLGKSKKFGF